MNQLDQPPPAIAVSVTTFMAAPPEAVYAVVSDVIRMGEFSPEAVSVTWAVAAPDGLPPVGTAFTGKNRLGWLTWRTHPVVTRAEPGQVFEFEVPAPSRSTWTYALRAVDGGTEVTESVRRQDPQPRVLRWLQRTAGVTDRPANLEAAMSLTLDRMAAAVQSTAPIA